MCRSQVAASFQLLFTPPRSPSRGLALCAQLLQGVCSGWRGCCSCCSSVHPWTPMVPHAHPWCPVPTPGTAAARRQLAAEPQHALLCSYGGGPAPPLPASPFIFGSRVVINDLSSTVFKI
uniref:Uncharacterized protein n=1 Tax=Anas platyrhynchos platyrhynchos TaxID=8840 RepID=A0A493U180_ANAPP